MPPPPSTGEPPVIPPVLVEPTEPVTPGPSADFPPMLVEVVSAADDVPIPSGTDAEPPRTASAIIGPPGSDVIALSAVRTAVFANTSPNFAARGGVGVTRGVVVTRATLGLAEIVRGSMVSCGHRPTRSGGCVKSAGRASVVILARNIAGTGVVGSCAPMKLWSRIAVGSLVLLAAACHKKEPKAPVGVSTASPTMYPPKKSASAQYVVGTLVASVSDSALGPFWSRRGTGDAATGMVSWLTPAEGLGRRIFTVPVDGNGTPRGPEAVVANVPVETGSLIVRPMRGASPGFVCVWTSLTDRGKALWSVAVGDDGKARGKPVEITRSNDDITWVDVVATDKGALLLWAEETRDAGVNVVGASLDNEGKVRESAVRVARGVVGWHALEIPGGVGLSTVTTAGGWGASPKFNGGKGGGALAFQHLDPDGHAHGQPVVVTNAPVVSGDVEVVRDRGRLFFAWTDRSAEEPAVSLAALDEKTNLVEGPRRVAEARGGAALQGLASGPAGLGLMFEAPARRKDDTRRVYVARVGDRLFLERPPFAAEITGKARPELAATATGFAVLATAADCDPGATECLNAPAVATVFRTDAKMELIQREPLTFGADPASLGWNLACDAEQCVTLSASGGAPARVRVVSIRPRVNAKPPVVAEAGAEPIARVDDVTAVSTGETVLKLASAGAVVAILGGTRDGTAVVTTRVVDAEGQAGKAEIVASKVAPTGGVGVAFGDKPDADGALAWVTKDGADAQVHVARIDKRGRRQGESALTASRGEKTDVTITWAGNGYVVAWIDNRDGNGEVYATRLGADLSRSGREERVTNAPGDASDLVALAHGDRVWLAWADPRESPHDGHADVYVAAVKKVDARRAGDEQRMLATAAHSRTPALADSPQGPTVAWIEEAPAGSESPNGAGFGAYWARLDPSSGKPAVKPARMQLAGDGIATAVAIEGSHAVVARSMVDAVALDGIDLGALQSAPLLALDGPPSLDVMLHFEGQVLYFNDEGPSQADRRARRAKIVWKN